MLGKRKLAKIRSFALTNSFRKWKRRREAVHNDDECSEVAIDKAREEEATIDVGIGRQDSRPLTPVLPLLGISAFAEVPSNTTELSVTPHVPACQHITSMPRMAASSPTRLEAVPGESAPVVSTACHARGPRRATVPATTVTPPAPLTPSATRAAVSSTVPVTPSVTKAAVTPTATVTISTTGITERDSATETTSTSAATVTSSTTWITERDSATETTATPTPPTAPSTTGIAERRSETETTVIPASVPTAPSAISSATSRLRNVTAKTRSTTKTAMSLFTENTAITTPCLAAISTTTAPTLSAKNRKRAARRERRLLRQSRKGPAVCPPELSSPKTDVPVTAPISETKISKPFAVCADEGGSTTTAASSELDALPSTWSKSCRVSWVGNSKRSKKKFMYLTTYKYGSIVDPERKTVDARSVPTTGILRNPRKIARP